MTPQPGQQTIEIHILTNTSRSKDNQSIKFDRLKEYNMRNIFFEKSSQSVVEKLFSDPFLKNKN